MMPFDFPRCGWRNREETSYQSTDCCTFPQILIENSTMCFISQGFKGCMSNRSSVGVPILSTIGKTSIDLGAGRVIKLSGTFK
jgi:hypothetical protein